MEGSWGPTLRKSARRCGPTLVALLAIFSATFTATAVGATPITSPSELNPGSTIIDFGNTYGVPEPFGDSIVTISSDRGSAVVRGGFPIEAGVVDAYWFGCSPLSGTCSYTIVFSTYVAEFGLGVVNPSVSGVVLKIRNSAGDLLEMTTIPQLGSGDSSFHGFVRSQNEIALAELYVPDPGFVGMDNVTYYTTPNPATGGLVGSGLLILGLVGRQRRA